MKAKDSAENSVPLSYPGHRLMMGLWVAVAALISIHVILTVVHYEVRELPWLLRQIFDVDEEDCLPTWYSASALLLNAAVLGAWAAELRRRRDPSYFYWLGLAVGFTGLSVDEIAGLHETLNSLIEVSWTIPGMVVAALVAGIYVPFLLSLPRRTAVRFAIGGAVYLGGAIGVELATEPYLENDELNTLAYNLWTAVEEGMEMGGVLIFLGALFGHMRANGGVTLRLGGVADPAPNAGDEPPAAR